MKMKFFPKVKSCYCFTPPTLLWCTYFIDGLKVVDVLFSCFLLAVELVKPLLISRH